MAWEYQKEVEMSSCTRDEAEVQKKIENPVGKDLG
jgi:hypothetical protein